MFISVNRKACECIAVPELASARHVCAVHSVRMWREEEAEVKQHSELGLGGPGLHDSLSV